jgi:hypothetical protein
MMLGEQRVVDEIAVSLEARYPTDEEEQAESEGWTAFDYLPSHGIWVALATFVPTFLAVVITGRAGPRSHIARSPLQYDVLEP